MRPRADRRRRRAASTGVAPFPSRSPLHGLSPTREFYGSRDGFRDTQKAAFERRSSSILRAWDGQQSQDSPSGALSKISDELLRTRLAK
jgi:hypothetical protein